MGLKALDLFCGGGGAALGLAAAGFDVVGIDCDKRSWRRRAGYYPGHLVVGDAIAPPVKLDAWDLVWASPPCQRWSVSTAVSRAAEMHPDLIAPVRSMLVDAGCCYVIENVPRAPIRADIKLRGSSVGLRRIDRLRHFEVGGWDPPLLQPLRPRLDRCEWESGRAVTITTSLAATSHYYPRKRAGLPGRVSVREAREAMGITTPMTGREVGEAVPPAYSEYIAREFIAWRSRARGAPAR